MSEVTDTRQILFPEGWGIFTATKPAMKKLTKNSDRPYYEFNFEAVVSNGGHSQIVSYKEILFPSQAAPLLKAFGCKEKEGEPGVFVWEKEEIIGRQIKARIAHEPDKKDPTRKRARMVEFEEVLSF